jgi:hypothetical protein
MSQCASRASFVCGSNFSISSMMRSLDLSRRQPRRVLGHISSNRFPIAISLEGTQGDKLIDAAAIYMIFTGPRSSFMLWNAAVFFLASFQFLSG